MMGRTHALSGAAAYLAAAPLLAARGLDTSATALLVGAVAAAGAGMLPDLDHPKASIARSMGPVTHVLARGVAWLSGGHRNGTHSILGLAVFTVIAVAVCAFGGWPLAILLALLFSLGLTALDIVRLSGVVYGVLLAVGTFALMGTTLWELYPVDTIPWAVGIGVAAHIAGDMLTPQRCPLLWLPVKVAPSVTRRRFGVDLITTSDKPRSVERVVVGPLLALLVVGLGVQRTGHWDVLSDIVGKMPVPAMGAAEPGAAPSDVTTVPSRPHVAGYDRDCGKGHACSFGPAWADVDRNGCDTRNDILRRDLIRTKAKPGTHGCKIVYGFLSDPYTGVKVLSPAKADIDHVVPLSAAWDLGAHRWPLAKRRAFANDPRNLLAAASCGQPGQVRRHPGTVDAPRPRRRPQVRLRAPLPRRQRRVRAASAQGRLGSPTGRSRADAQHPHGSGVVRVRHEPPVVAVRFEQRSLPRVRVGLALGHHRSGVELGWGSGGRRQSCLAWHGNGQ